MLIRFEQVDCNLPKILSVCLSVCSLQPHTLLSLMFFSVPEGFRSDPGPCYSEDGIRRPVSFSVSVGSKFSVPLPSDSFSITFYILMSFPIS